MDIDCKNLILANYSKCLIKFNLMKKNIHIIVQARLESYDYQIKF